MARRLSTGISGKNVLGSIVAVENSLRSVTTNDDVILQASGTGISASTTDFNIRSGNVLRLSDDDSTNYVGLTAPATVSSNVTFTMPGTDGSNGQVLSTNGSGALGWTTSEITITDTLTGSTTYYLTFTDSSSGGTSGVGVSSTKLSYRADTGTLTATAIAESSSIALKENLNPITDALEKITNLNAFTYDRKDGSSKNEAGLIAEEVDKVLPNLVQKDENGNPSSINYTKLSAYLIEAVKDLSKQIRDLKAS